MFLNKCDLLEKKLKAGARVNKYIPRYGDKENKMSVFGKCTSRIGWIARGRNSYRLRTDIRDKFRDYMKEYSPIERPFYGYLTSVVVRPPLACALHRPLTRISFSSFSVAEQESDSSHDPIE